MLKTAIFASLPFLAVFGVALAGVKWELQRVYWIVSMGVGIFGLAGGMYYFLERIHVDRQRDKEERIRKRITLILEQLEIYSVAIGRLSASCTGSSRLTESAANGSGLRIDWCALRRYEENYERRLDRADAAHVAHVWTAATHVRRPRVDGPRHGDGRRSSRRFSRGHYGGAHRSASQYCGD